MSISSNEFSQIICSDILWCFQIIKTEHYAFYIRIPLTFFFFFCLNNRDDRAVNQERYIGWLSLTGPSLVVQGVKDTNLLAAVSWLQFTVTSRKMNWLHFIIEMSLCLFYFISYRQAGQQSIVCIWHWILLTRNLLRASKKGE